MKIQPMLGMIQTTRAKEFSHLRSAQFWQEGATDIIKNDVWANICWDVSVACALTAAGMKLAKVIGAYLNQTMVSASVNTRTGWSLSLEAQAQSMAFGNTLGPIAAGALVGTVAWSMETHTQWSDSLVSLIRNTLTGPFGRAWRWTRKGSEIAETIAVSMASGSDTVDVKPSSAQSKIQQHKDIVSQLIIACTVASSQGIMEWTGSQWRSIELNAPAAKHKLSWYSQRWGNQPYLDTFLKESAANVCMAKLWHKTNALLINQYNSLQTLLNAVQAVSEFEVQSLLGSSLAQPK